MTTITPAHYDADDLEVPSETAFSTAEVTLEVNRVVREQYVTRIKKAAINLVGVAILTYNLFLMQTVSRAKLNPALERFGQTLGTSPEATFQLVQLFTSFGILVFVYGVVKHIYYRHPRDEDKLVMAAMRRLTERGGLYYKAGNE